MYLHKLEPSRTLRARLTLCVCVLAGRGIKEQLRGWGVRDTRGAANQRARAPRATVLKLGALARDFEKGTIIKSLSLMKTPFKKIRRIIVRGCPLSQPLTIKMSDFCACSQTV